VRYVHVTIVTFGETRHSPEMNDTERYRRSCEEDKAHCSLPFLFRQLRSTGKFTKSGRSYSQQREHMRRKNETTEGHSPTAPGEMLNIFGSNSWPLNGEPSASQPFFSISWTFCNVPQLERISELKNDTTARLKISKKMVYVRIILATSSRVARSMFWL